MQALAQTIADEPAARDVGLRFPRQPAVGLDPEQQAAEHQSDLLLRIDTEPVIVQAVAVRHSSRNRNDS